MRVPVAPHHCQCLLLSVWPFFICVMVFYCCFNLNFSDDVWFGASFHVLICHLYIFFVVMSVKVFDPFFNQIVYFLIVEF